MQTKFSNNFSGSRGNFRPRNQSSNRSPRSSRRSAYIDPRFFVQKSVQESTPAYVSQHQFSDFDISVELKETIAEKNYFTPTPIQDKSIPVLLEGKDVLGIANTGTGKTAAFLLPLIEKVCNDISQNVLIIVPTRELAVQIDEEFRFFASRFEINSVVCIGGTSMHRQIMQLRNRPNFVIGTPGRLKDLDRQRVINFRDYASIVLDEVDRMLDMGFLNEIKYIIAKLPSPRQSLFFSATLPTNMKELVRSFLSEPVTISVQENKTSINVDQDVVKIGNRNKVDVLHDLLIQEEFQKVLVFGRTKRGIQKLSENLERRGFKVAAIHGNKNQSQRQKAIVSFKQDRVRILLATDVVARGLDISNVTHVINFDIPESYDDYIHRIGRTGRADKKGMALTFID